MSTFRSSLCIKELLLNCYFALSSTNQVGPSPQHIYYFQILTVKITVLTYWVQNSEPIRGSNYTDGPRPNELSRVVGIGGNPLIWKVVWSNQWLGVAYSNRDGPDAYDCIQKPVHLIDLSL